jgi:hypothetical protein
MRSIQAAAFRDSFQSENDRVDLVWIRVNAALP